MNCPDSIPSRDRLKKIIKQVIAIKGLPSIHKLKGYILEEVCAKTSLRQVYNPFERPSKGLLEIYLRSDARGNSITIAFPPNIHIQ